MPRIKIQAINVECDLDGNAGELLSTLIGSVFGALGSQPDSTAQTVKLATTEPTPTVDAPKLTAQAKPVAKRKAPAAKAKPANEPTAVVAKPARMGGAKQAVHEYLGKHPGSSYRQIADGTGFGYQTVWTQVTNALGETIRATGSGNTFELIG